MTSVFAEPIPYFLELEPVVGDGPPRVRITVYNVPGTQRVRLTRTAGGETWIVPGVGARSVTDVGVFEDWFCPLGVPVTYTVRVGGEAAYSETITIETDVSWLQDPLRPDVAIPIYRGQRLRPGHLLMRRDTARTVSRPSGVSGERTGGKYAVAMAGDRSGLSGVPVVLTSFDRDVDDRFRQLVDRAPILVFRPEPAVRNLPPLCYIGAEVEETIGTSDANPASGTTHFRVTGDLFAAITQQAISGFITYGQVDELLGQYTYGEVQDMQAQFTYLDLQKNPLIIQTSI